MFFVLVCPFTPTCPLIGTVEILFFCIKKLDSFILGVCTSKLELNAEVILLNAEVILQSPF